MKNFVSITLSDSRSDDPSITDKSGDVLISFLVSNNLNLYERILIPDDPSELESALEKSNGMVSQASDSLKLRRTTLIEKMKKYGITKEDKP